MPKEEKKAKDKDGPKQKREDVKEPEPEQLDVSFYQILVSRLILSQATTGFKFISWREKISK